MGKNVGKNISKNLGSKYTQKCFYHSKQFVAVRVTKIDTNALKIASKRAITKTTEVTGDFIGNNL